MPNMTGHFTGNYTVQTVVACQDTPDHVMTLAEVHATQSCSDEMFNNTKHTGWGTTDLTKGHGHQRGYFINEHPNGDRESGTFEGKISTSNGQVTSEGTWTYTHGTGKFKGISGNGKFKGRMTSPTQVEMSWEGNYQLAAGSRAA
jgi:hypothetical protein